MRKKNYDNENKKKKNVAVVSFDDEFINMEKSPFEISMDILFC